MPLSGRSVFRLLADTGESNVFPPASMNPQRTLVLFLSFLFSLILIGKVAAGDSHVFPSFNTGTITGGQPALTQSLNVSSLPANEYISYTVVANFVPGAAPKDAYSNTINVEITNGGTTVYKTESTANVGVLAASGPTTLRWTGLLAQPYTGGTPLSIRIRDHFTDANGPYTSSLSNVTVTLHPNTTQKHTFPTFNTTKITNDTSGYTRTLTDSSSIPAGEYLMVVATADFVADPAPADAYSNTLRMELTNGSSVTYMPASLASSGLLPNSSTTTLRWVGLMSRPYSTGPLAVRIFDPYKPDNNQPPGPFRASVNNVSISIYAVPAPVKTFGPLNPGTISSANSGYSATLDTSGMSGDYVYMSVTGDYTPTGSNPAWSNTMTMALTNGSATNYLPERTANLGVLGSATATSLTWYGMMPVSYLAGGPLRLNFRDNYNTGGPYTSTMNNVVVKFYPVPTLSTTVTSLNRMDTTPSNSSTVNWLLTFPTTVTGVTAANFSLTASGGASGTIGSPSTGNGGLTWTIPVTTGTGTGDLTLNLANATGLSSTISTSLPYSGGTYVIDRTAPTVSISNPSAVTTKNGPVSYTVTYADANFSSSTLATGNITLNRTGSANGTVAVSGTGTTRTVTISSITGEGTLGISIAASTATDTAGNSALAAGPSALVTVDATAPTITIAAPSATRTRNGPITYLVTYADANFNSSTLSTSNITLNSTGTASGTLGVSGTGTTRTVTISSITGNGTLGISIASGTGSDTAGNTTPAAGPSATFEIDNTGPGISIGSPSASLTKAGPVTYTVTYSGADFSISTLSTPNVTLNKTGTANGTVGVSGSGNTRTVTISSITGDGTLGISIAAGTATDSLGNTSGATGPSATFTVDNSAPVVTSPSTATGTFGASFTYTIAASGSPVSYSATPEIPGLSLTGSTLSGTPTLAGTYTVTLGAVDAAGNNGTQQLALTINKATATVTLGNLVQAYDGSAKVVSYTTIPPNLGVQVTFNGSPTAPVNAGSHNVNAIISDQNYEGSVIDTLVINKAVLNVKAESVFRPYGEANPTFTVSYSGFVGTDDASAVTGNLSFSTTATPTSPLGEYPLEIAVGSLSAPNYSFTFTNGIVYVTWQTPDDLFDEYFNEEELQNPAISGSMADADSDGIPNLLEIAFGTDPRDNASGPPSLSYDGTLAGGGTLVSPGQPIPVFEPAPVTGLDYRAVFIRRNPDRFTGLRYTPEFSANLTTWQASTEEPTVLATSGDLQVVSVPYPLFVGGKKTKFFRVSVSLVAPPP